MSPLLVAALFAVAVWAWPARTRPPFPASFVPAPTGEAEVPGEVTTSADVAEVCRLLGAALHGGIGVLEALDVVAAYGPAPACATLQRVAAAQRWGEPSAGAWAGCDPCWEPIAAALIASESAGLSPVRALASAAQRMERERRARAQRQLARLEVLVVLPLGLAFLPGFVATTVVPIVIALLRSTLAGAS